MRIAADVGVLDAHWGGIPKYVDRVITELLRAGDRVDLLANTRHLGHRIPDAHEVGVRVKGLVFWREVFLPMWLATKRPDVFWAPASILPRVTPVPSVVTVHDLATMRFPGTKPRAEERWFETSIRRSARDATRVIAVSRTTANDTAELWGLDMGHIRVVPHGVDDAYQPGDIPAAQAAVAGRWSIDSPFVLHVGSIEPRKGLDVLIDAATRAHVTGSSWRLVLAGAPQSLGAATIAAAERTGRVDVLGPVDEEDLVMLYRAAAAVALPAIYEGFGLPALEAMACGTPVVIAGGSGGLEEVSGSAAIVVPDRDPQSWCHRLALAMARPEGLIAQGRTLAAQFRWPAVAAQARAIMAEAASEGRGGNSARR